MFHSPDINLHKHIYLIFTPLTPWPMLMISMTDTWHNTSYLKHIRLILYHKLRLESDVNNQRHSTKK